MSDRIHAYSCPYPEGCNCGAGMARSKQQANGSAASDCSTVELIAAKNLLRGWIACHKHDLPGAWDYNKENARLVEESAALLGIENPWKQ